MTSKQRVFSHPADINYNDYIKNKMGIEILKNIKSSKNHDNVIKKFRNHDELINFTKTYYNYYNLNNYSLRATKDLYNSNSSFVENNVNKYYNNIVNNSTDNACIQDECLELSRFLYPYGVYSSNTSKKYLHFNLDLNKWCVKKSLVDYNSIYNLDNININIDGYNICNKNDGSCYDIGNKKHNSEKVDDNCKCNKTKCKTGLCKNAKPLFISTFEKG